MTVPEKLSERPFPCTSLSLIQCKSNLCQISNWKISFANPTKGAEMLRLHLADSCGDEVSEETPGPGYSKELRQPLRLSEGCGRPVSASRWRRYGLRRGFGIIIEARTPTMAVAMQRFRVETNSCTKCVGLERGKAALLLRSVLKRRPRSLRLQHWPRLRLP